MQKRLCSAKPNEAAEKKLECSRPTHVRTDQAQTRQGCGPELVEVIKMKPMIERGAFTLDVGANAGEYILRLGTRVVDPHPIQV
jgi:hypothetical protein